MEEHLESNQKDCLHFSLPRSSFQLGRWYISFRYRHLYVSFTRINVINRDNHANGNVKLASHPVQPIRRSDPARQDTTRQPAKHSPFMYYKSLLISGVYIENSMWHMLSEAQLWNPYATVYSHRSAKNAPLCRLICHSSTAICQCPVQSCNAALSSVRDNIAWEVDPVKLVRPYGILSYDTQ